MILPRFKLTLLVLGFTLIGLQGRADVDLQGLVNHSPFGEGKTGAGGERVGSLEFRGYYVDNGITYFSIYNPSSKSSVWVAEGETSTSPFAVSVKSFDSDKNAVTLESNGQSMRLALHDPVILKMELPATPVATPANNNGATPTAMTAVVGNATAGQTTNTEQAQNFKDTMRQRWQDRQNQNGGTDNNKNKGNKAAEATTASENTNTAKKGQKNKAN